MKQLVVSSVTYFAFDIKLACPIFDPISSHSHFAKRLLLLSCLLATICTGWIGFDDSRAEANVVLHKWTIRLQLKVMYDLLPPRPVGV